MGIRKISRIAAVCGASIACITALQAVGNELSTTMSTVSTTLDGNNTIS